MRKKAILITLFFVAMICFVGCGNSVFNDARIKFKPLYLEITDDTFELGDEDKVETSEISKIFNDEKRAEKILELKDIVVIMEQNAESKKEKRILVDYRDFYDAIVQIQSYTTPDEECSVEEIVERNTYKMLISMGRDEAKGESNTRY